jgi:GNAT superfamily N-acetyltransferase
MPLSTANFEIRRISEEETRPLRLAILRPGQPPSALSYRGDDGPDTLHVGAFRDGVQVGVASVYREPKPGVPDPGTWRLRGMATVAEVRRQGVGSELLNACIQHARSHGGALMWFNAREGAVKFYEANGFAKVGDRFDLEDLGPHYVMQRAI